MGDFHGKGVVVGELLAANKGEVGERSSARAGEPDFGSYRFIPVYIEKAELIWSDES